MQHSTKANTVPEITLDLRFTPASGAPVHALIEENKSAAANGAVLNIGFTVWDFSSLPVSFEARVNVRFPV